MAATKNRRGGNTYQKSGRDNTAKSLPVLYRESASHPSSSRFTVDRGMKIETAHHRRKPYSLRDRTYFSIVAITPVEHHCCEFEIFCARLVESTLRCEYPGQAVVPSKVTAGFFAGTDMMGYRQCHKGRRIRRTVQCVDRQ